MKTVVNHLLALAGCIGLVVSLVMLVMAIRFGELGRVLFYLVLAVVCGELAGFAIARIVRKRT